MAKNNCLSGDIFASALLQTELFTPPRLITEVAQLAVSLLMRWVQTKQPVELSAAKRCMKA